MDAHDVVGRVRHLEGVRVLADHSADQVDLLECNPGGTTLPHGLRRDPRHPELRADTALSQTWDVRMQVGLWLGKVQDVK